MLLMEHISTIRDLIGLWPARRDLAEEIAESVGEDVGKLTERINGWVRANSMPAKYHHAVIAAAQARDLAVTAELVVRLHARTGVRGAAA